MKYNYIFFNEIDDVLHKRNDMYFSICVADLERNKQVQIVSCPVDYAPSFIRFLYRLHNNRKYISLPLKQIWFPFYFKKVFFQHQPLCFIFSGTRYYSVEYLRYLKRKYPRARIVKIHRDLIDIWHKKEPQYTEPVCKELFDLRLSFDAADAKKYHTSSFCEFESKVDVPIAEDYPLSDVFFAGLVKDRLPSLLEAYRLLTAVGLKCSYYLTGVPQNERIPLSGIIYADKQMTYREMLYRTVNSRCVLEINQGGAVGYTSRFLEAVMYNKKLITDNITIRNTKFYDPRYIQCVDDVRDIRPEFITEDVGKVDYHYNNEFSPIHLIEQIDEELIKLDAKEGRP